MTKNKLLWVSVLSSLGLASVAAAQHRDGEHFFEKLDANGDGTVTTAELEQGALARWTSSDTNKDGKVTAEEVEAQLAIHKQEQLTKKDTNGNGQLERGELANMPAARFAALDADKNGSLSQTELAAVHPLGKKGKALLKGKGKGLLGDADGDGAITKAEAVAGIQQMAKKLDANGDGKLTQEELAQAHGMHGGHGAKGPAKARSAGAGDAG